jgi:NAD(P)-dependent dehydrogenase (short-subunit alcohol dehydrogenase family)
MSSEAAETGDVVVVTGAGRGIGRALAIRLAANGRHVVAVARTAAEVEAVAANDPRIRAVVADVATEEGIAAAAAAADSLGRLSAWINNAAILEPVAFADLEPAIWDRVLACDLRAVYLGCRAAFSRMAAGDGGVIVNIGSLSGMANVEKFPGLSAYNVAKAGVIALTEGVALEGREHGVRCVCLSPGAVDTDMLRRAAPHLRPGVTPEDVAEIVAFLLEPAAAPLSGSNIPIFSNR